MSFISQDIELNQQLKGKRIAKAQSSLTSLAIGFEDGSGILLQAFGTADNPEIQTRIMPSAELPSIGDAVCKIEWAWIASSKIESVTSTGDSVKFNLNPAGTLTVMAQVWQGSLFLSFAPYKAAK